MRWLAGGVSFWEPQEAEGVSLLRGDSYLVELYSDGWRLYVVVEPGAVV